MAVGESEEGNLAFFNKALSKIMNKTRLHDGTCAFLSSTADLKPSVAIPL